MQKARFWEMGYDLSSYGKASVWVCDSKATPHFGLLEQEPEVMLEAEDRAGSRGSEKLMMV